MKVLLVDDSEAIRNPIRRELTAAGYQVIEAEDGVKGLEALKANTDIKIVLSDVNMPEMDGITMCTKINDMEEFKHVHLLVLTTEFDPELKAKGKAAGVKLWVTKPVKASKLVAVINKLAAM